MSILLCLHMVTWTAQLTQLSRTTKKALVVNMRNQTLGNVPRDVALMSVQKYVNAIQCTHRTMCEAHLVDLTYSSSVNGCVS